MVLYDGVFMSTCATVLIETGVATAVGDVSVSAIDWAPFLLEINSVFSLL